MAQDLLLLRKDAHECHRTLDTASADMRKLRKVLDKLDARISNIEDPPESVSSTQDYPGRPFRVPRRKKRKEETPPPPPPEPEPEPVRVVKKKATVKSLVKSVTKTMLSESKDDIDQPMDMRSISERLHDELVQKWVSFESYSSRASFLRHVKSKGGVAQVLPVGLKSSEEKASATFMVVEGLATGCCVSFMSKNAPEHYLRFTENRVRLEPMQPDSLNWKREASWTVRPGLNEERFWISFESIAKRGFYMRADNKNLMVEKLESVPSGAFLNSCTFLAVPGLGAKKSSSSAALDDDAAADEVVEPADQ